MPLHVCVWVCVCACVDNNHCTSSLLPSWILSRGFPKFHCSSGVDIKFLPSSLSISTYVCMKTYWQVPLRAPDSFSSISKIFHPIKTHHSTRLKSQNFTQHAECRSSPPGPLRVAQAASPLNQTCAGDICPISLSPLGHHCWKSQLCCPTLLLSGPPFNLLKLFKHCIMQNPCRRSHPLKPVWSHYKLWEITS